MRREDENLTCFPCFDDLASAELQELFSAIVAFDYAAGEVLCRQGESGGEIYLIDSAEVDVLLTTESGDERPVVTLGRGSVLGEISFLLALPRSATAVVRTPGLIWGVSNEQFRKSLDAREPWANRLVLAMAQGLAQRLIAIDRELLALIAHPEPLEPSATARLGELEQLRKTLFQEWSF
jgi:CRP/FNR family cyclic AMP-dependent transcriptional regulator